MGSNATTSAEFAFTGVANNTPVASISAVTGGAPNGLSFNGSTSTIQSLNDKTLIIGGSSTGNIIVDSQSLLNLNTVNNKAITTGTGLTTLGGNLTVNGAGVTLAGNSSIIDMTGTGTLGLDTTTNRAITTGTGLTTLGGNLTVNGAGVTLAGNSSIIDMTGTGTLGLDTTTNRAITTGTGLTTLGGNLTVNGATINLGNASSTTIQTTGANTSLTLGANGTGTLLLNSSATSGVEIGSAIVTPQAPLFINGGIGNNGALIVNNTNSGDLIDASASGLTKFQVTNGGSLNLAAGQTIDTLTNGTLGIGTTNATTITIGRTSNTISLPGYNNAGGIFYSNSGTLALTGTGTGSQCLLGGSTPTWGSCSTGTANYWQQNLGTVEPASITNDLLLGSNATTSAEFAFTGVANNTPVASISAVTGGAPNGLSFNGSTSTIQSLNDKTLIIGGSSTGNIIVDSQSLLNLNTVNNKAITTGTGLTTLGGNLTVNGAGVTLAGNSSIIDMTGTGTLGLDTTTNRAITTGTGLTTLGGNLTVNGAGVTLAGNSSIIDMTGTGTLGLDTTTNRAITTGTGLTTLGGNLTVNGATINLGNASSTTIQTTGANTSLTLGANGTGTLLLNSSATSGVEIGSAIVTPQAPLFINGGIGNNGALIVNNTNSGDLIDASASGLTKFQVTNGGSLNLAAGQTIDTLTNGTLGIGTTNATTITIGRTSNTISLPGYNNAGGIFYSNSGTLALTGTGTGSQCLLGGSTPTWGSCSTGTANYWQQNLGTVEPASITNDLLLGSNATTSAEFAFTGVANNTPVASISAVTGGAPNGLSFNGSTSTIQSLNDKTLIIGGSSTGNIIVDSQSLLNLNTVNNKAITTGTGLTTLGGNLTVNGAGVTLAGNSSIIDMTGTGTLGLDTTTNRAITTGTGLTTLGGNLTVNGAGVTLAGNSSIIDMTGTGTLGLDTTTNRAITTGTGLTTLGGNLTVNGATINLGNASSTTIQTTGANTSLTLGANGTGTLLLNSSATSGVEIGSAIVTPKAPLFINGGIGNNGALIVNNTNSGDLIDASASGATKFEVNNNGDIELAGNTSFLTTINSLATAAQTISLPNGSGTICLSINNCAADSIWNAGGGTIFEGNTTEDLLLGGTSTASADFAVTGMAGTTPAASLSAATANGGNGNGISLSASTSTIQSLLNNTLTIGGNTTGNILFKPGNNSTMFVGSNGKVGIGSVNPNANLEVVGATVLGNGSSGSALSVQNTNGVSVFTVDTSANVVAVGAVNTASAGTQTRNSEPLEIGGQYWTGAASSGLIYSLETMVSSATPNYRLAFMNNSNAEVMSLDQYGDLGINSTAPAATLDVRSNNASTPVASVSGASNIANMVVDQSGTGDIFTASKSGATKFTILNNGNISMNNYNNCGMLTTVGTILTCSVASGGTNYFQLNSNVISQGNTTEDLMLGGTSTASAKFAFIGNAGTATPIASISAQSGGTTGLVMNGGGSIQSLNNNTLTIGGNTTGNISFQPNNQQNLYLASSGRVGLGNTNPTNEFSVGVDLGATGSPATTIAIGNTSGASILTVGQDNINRGALYWSYNATPSLAYLDLTTNGGQPIAIQQGGGLVGIGTTSPFATLDVRSSSATLPDASISGATTFAEAVVDQSGTGDLFTASKSGATKFVIQNNGNIGIAANQIIDTLTNGGLGIGTVNATTLTLGRSGGSIDLPGYGGVNNSILFANSSVNGVLTAVAATNANNQCLLSNSSGTPSWGSCDLGTTSWVQANGTIYQGNITEDLLLGGSSTASAKFAFIGDAGTAIPVASISAQSGGKTGLVLSGGGSIQALNDNTLTIGGNTTGDILLEPLNGTAGQVQFFNGNNFITSAGAMTLASTGNALNLSGGGANIDFTGAGVGQIITATNQNLALMPGGTGDVGVNVSSGLLATLDVRGNRATTPAASVSATSTYAAMEVNNNGTGDLFTASSSGLTQFVITQGGNVEVGNSYPVANGLQIGDNGVSATPRIVYDSDYSTTTGFANFVGGWNSYSLWGIGPADGSSSDNLLRLGIAGINTNGTSFWQTTQTLNLAIGGNLGVGVGNSNTAMGYAALTVNQPNTYGDLFTASSSGVTKFDINNSGSVGIGTTSQLATLDVRGNTATTPAASVSATSTYAALDVNNNGTGDLFTASKSGASKFTVLNNGNIQINNYTQNDGILYTTATGTVAQAASGSNGQVLQLNGTTPQWVNAGTAGITQWQLNNNGTISQYNLTNDLLLGGTSTASADFAFTGLSGTTPIASISAIDNGGNKNGISLNASAGQIQSLQDQTLTIGGNTTGNILLQPLNGTAGQVQFFSASSNITSAGNLTLAGTITENGTGTSTFDSNTISLAGSNSTIAITTPTNSSIALDPSGTGGVIINAQTTPLASLDVRANLATQAIASISGATTFAGLVVNNSGSGDLFTASTSGLTRFTVKNSGLVVIGNSTNGIIFDPTDSSNPGGQIYFGLARPTRQIVLTPEYAGAVITASNSAYTNGFMTANASQSAALGAYNYENYYQWSSSQTSLNDYTVAVTVSLPKDFSGWPSSGNAITIDYNTALATPADNALDVYIYNKGDTSGVPVWFITNQASAQKTWTQIGITGAQLSAAKPWNLSIDNGQAVIYLKMHAMNTVNYVQVGDIKLNYLSAF